MKKLHIHYFMPQGIGDVIMTLPVLHEIHKRNKVKFSISVKSKTEASVISAICPDLDIEFIFLKDLFSNNFFPFAIIQLIRKIREYSPDIIFTQFNVSAAKSSIISLLSGARIRVGWKGPLSQLNTHILSPSGLHKIAENLKSLQAINIDITDIPIAYPLFHPNMDEIQSESIKNIIESKRFKICISPGSQHFDEHKRWSKADYSKLIKKIITEDKNVGVYLLGDPSERDLCQQIINDSGSDQRVVNLAGKTDIYELLTLLNSSDLTIANCNGISHLACSAGSSIIGLYGPTNYRITGPISKNFIPITAGLDCSPCYRRDYRLGCGDPVCMEKIKVDVVYEKVQKIIAGKEKLRQ